MIAIKEIFIDKEFLDRFRSINLSLGILLIIGDGMEFAKLSIGHWIWIWIWPHMIG